MAVTTDKFDQIDSSELFDAAISDDPAPEVAEQVAEAEVAEQPRGPDGKFMPKAAEVEKTEPVQAQAETPEAKDEGAVPPWRLREMREERDAERARAENAAREAAQFRSEMEALRRQIAQQNAPEPEPVDIFADPNKFMEQQLSPLEQRMQSMMTTMTLRASKAENISIHGRDTVVAAEKAVEEAMSQRDPEVNGLRAKMLASDDPVGVAVDWYKSRSLLKETGGDLNAYRQKALEEALNDPAFLQRALERAREGAGGQPKPRTEINLPPRISRLPSAQSISDGDGDMSDAALFAAATR